MFVDSGGQDARWRELGAQGSVEGFVVEQLVPWAAERFAIEGFVVVGQSLGGLTALRCALARPDVVTGAISHSASLWQDDLQTLVGHAGAATRIYLSHGTQEWVLAGPHHELTERLLAVGVQLESAAVCGGHDYAWWRGGVADGLRWMFAPEPGSQGLTSRPLPRRRSTA